MESSEEHAHAEQKELRKDTKQGILMRKMKIAWLSREKAFETSPTEQNQFRSSKPFNLKWQQLDRRH
jgi:hypothetical protein